MPGRRHGGHSLVAGALPDRDDHGPAPAKIYNWTTYPGILLALAASGGGAAAVAAGVNPQRLAALGWITPNQSALGLAVCGLAMLVCFVLFRIGGGDVKLIAMLGAIMGPEQGITAMLWTFVLGGCVGLIVLVWRVGALTLVARVFRQVFWAVRLRVWNPLTADERAQLQPPLFLAPCALAAVVIVRFDLFHCF